MFGIGYLELMVLGLLLILLFPPRELPKLARSAARIYGSVRRVADEFHRTVLLDEELRQPLGEIREAYDQARWDVREAGKRMQGELKSAAEEAKTATSSKSLRGHKEEPSAAPPDKLEAKDEAAAGGAREESAWSFEDEPTRVAPMPQPGPEDVAAMAAKDNQGFALPPRSSRAASGNALVESSQDLEITSPLPPAPVGSRLVRRNDPSLEGRVAAGVAAGASPAPHQDSTTSSSSSSPPLAPNERTRPPTTPPPPPPAVPRAIESRKSSRLPVPKSLDPEEESKSALSSTPSTTSSGSEESAPA